MQKKRCRISVEVWQKSVLVRALPAFPTSASSSPFPGVGFLRASFNISMEAQTFLSNSTIPSTKTCKKPFFKAPEPRPLSLRAQHCVSSQRVLSKGRLVCKNSSERAKDSVVVGEENSKAAIKGKKLAVFISGGGSNFRSIHEACLGGSVNGDVVVLVTNKEGCGGAEYARNMGIPVILFPRTREEPDGLSPKDLVTFLGRFGVDFILLAGYLKLIPVELIRAYPRSILNIHPSLLPAFGGKGYYGMKVHKAVIASGARYSGPTIHFVDERYDTGQILAQGVVPVLANDTAEDLAARVLKEEHRLYVEVTAALCEDRIVWREDGVPLIQSKEYPNGYH